MKQITLAITHFERFEFLQECIALVLDDARIGEIVISDDASMDGSFERLKKHFAGKPKVKLFRNKTNLGCYFNKRAAVQRASLPWVILFDSDNIMCCDYLDRIFYAEWDEDVALLPVKASPHFDYSNLSGATVTRENIGDFAGRAGFFTALNTANYFFNRDNWLKVFDGSIEPHTADSIFQNYNWLKAGFILHFIHELSYFHRVHSGSHYKLNVHKTGGLAKQIEAKIKKL